MRPAATILALLALAGVARAQWVSASDAEARRSEQKAYEIWVQCPPGGCRPYCPPYYYYADPRPYPQPRPQQPQTPNVPHVPKFDPATDPPLVPVKPVPKAEADPSPPEKPEPDLDPQVWERWKAELEQIAKSTAAAEAKAEVSLIVKQEVASAACNCGDEIAKLEQRIASLEQSQVAQVEVNQGIRDSLGALDDALGNLKHSATITLLDGTTKTQTKPLDQPLEFNQRIRNP